MSQPQRISNTRTMLLRELSDEQILRFVNELSPVPVRRLMERETGLVRLMFLLNDREKTIVTHRHSLAHGDVGEPFLTDSWLARPAGWRRDRSKLAINRQ